MNEKDKLKAFLKAERIQFSTFTQTVGVSQGFLNSGASLGVDKLKLIVSKYPQLSLDWLLFDKGDMIINEPIRDEKTILDRLSNIEDFIKKLKPFLIYEK